MGWRLDDTPLTLQPVGADRHGWRHTSCRGTRASTHPPALVPGRLCSARAGAIPSQCLSAGRPGPRRRANPLAFMHLACARTGQAGPWLSSFFWKGLRSRLACASLPSATLPPRRPPHCRRAILPPWSLFLFPVVDSHQVLDRSGTVSSGPWSSSRLLVCVCGTLPPSPSASPHPRITLRGTYPYQPHPALQSIPLHSCRFPPLATFSPLLSSNIGRRRINDSTAD